VHAGAGYVNLNCRLHQFFDNKNVKRATDETGNLRKLFDTKLHPACFSFSVEE
jgi:hypothetical protein